MIELKIIQNQTVVRTLQFEKRSAAKKAYENHSYTYDQYVQLVVNGQEYTTAQARRYFRLPKL